MGLALGFLIVAAVGIVFGLMWQWLVDLARRR